MSTTAEQFLLLFQFADSVVPQVILRRRSRLKCGGTHAETRFRLLAKRTSTFKSVGESVRSTNGSRGMRVDGSNVPR